MQTDQLRTTCEAETEEEIWRIVSLPLSCFTRDIPLQARDYSAQSDSLKRYRSKGQQPVRVERVNVKSGRQAVVETSLGETGHLLLTTALKACSSAGRL